MALSSVSISNIIDNNNRTHNKWILFHTKTSPFDNKQCLLFQNIHLFPKKRKLAIPQICCNHFPKNHWRRKEQKLHFLKKLSLLGEKCQLCLAKKLKKLFKKVRKYQLLMIIPVTILKIFNRNKGGLGRIQRKFR